MTRPLDPAEKARRAQERKGKTALGETPQFTVKKQSKAATVRALLNKGKTKVEIAKKTGIPYAYIWDIEAAWKRSKEASK
jgi:hypothetical protein